jgi:hypothetical protein
MLSEKLYFDLQRQPPFQCIFEGKTSIFLFVSGFYLQAYVAMKRHLCVEARLSALSAANLTSNGLIDRFGPWLPGSNVYLMYVYGDVHFSELFYEVHHIYSGCLILMRHTMMFYVA